MLSRKRRRRFTDRHNRIRELLLIAPFHQGKNMRVPGILIREECTLPKLHAVTLGFVLEEHFFQVSGKNVSLSEQHRNFRILEQLSFVNRDRQFDED